MKSTSASLDASRRPSSTPPSPKTKIDLKIVIMGHGGVGKTSFIHRYIHNDFTETISTIGASFVLKKWKNFYYGIWDTAGQERFTKISSYYCRGAQAAILAYDITDRGSYEALDNYVKFLMDADKDCMIVVIGTKLDLVTEDPNIRQVPTEEAEKYARSQRGIFYETSAKDGLNVTQVFDRIGYQCLASKLSDKIDSECRSPNAMEGSRMVMAAASNPVIHANSQKGCACIIQ